MHFHQSVVLRAAAMIAREELELPMATLSNSMCSTMSPVRDVSMITSSSRHTVQEIVSISVGIRGILRFLSIGGRGEGYCRA